MAKDDEVPGDSERCTRNDGKGWRCKKRKAEGKEMCEYHYEYQRTKMKKSSAPKRTNVSIKRDRRKAKKKEERDVVRSREENVGDESGEEDMQESSSEDEGSAEKEVSEARKSEGEGSAEKMAGAQNGIANGTQNGSGPADTAATPPLQPTAVEQAISRLFRDLAVYRWNQGHMEDRLENCGHTLIAANRQMAKLKWSRKRLSRKLTLLRHQHGYKMAQLKLRIGNLQAKVTQQQTQLKQLTATEHSATGGHHVRDV